MPRILCETKHYQVTLKIRELVSTMQAGETLPTMEYLMHRFEASHGTVAQALKRLVADGLIYRDWGRKTYQIAKVVNKAVAQILVLRPDFPASTLDHLLADIYAAGKEFGWAFKPICYRETSSLDFAELSVGMDAILFHPTSEILTPELIHSLRKPQCPVMVFMEQANDDAILNVCYDDFEIGRMAAKTLVEKGYKRIAFMKDQPYESTMIERYRGFRAGMKEAGVRWSRNSYLDTGVISWGDPLVTAYRFVSETVSSRLSEFDAIFTATEVGGMALLRYCYEKGIRIPTELAVLSYTSDEIIPLYLMPKLSTVTCFDRDFSCESINLLQQVLKGGKTEKPVRKIAPCLMLRESI